MQLPPRNQRRPADRGPAAEGAGAGFRRGAIGNHGAPAPATDGAAGGCQHITLQKFYAN